MDKQNLSSLISQLEQLLAEQHQQQVKRAEAQARNINARLTSEDLLNPDNFPEVITNPDYMYEEGQAAGILAAKMAVMAFLRGK